MYNNYFIGEAMTAKIFSGDQKIKLTQLINEGMTVLHEIDTLNEGLSDTVKAIAEELEVKPSVLKKAIRVAHKASLTQTNADNEELNTILETVGKTL
jgi:DNA-binding MarR family transcriptional regulator